MLPRRGSFLCADAQTTLTAAAATGLRARRRFSALPIIGLLARHLFAAPAASRRWLLCCGRQRIARREVAAGHSLRPTFRLSASPRSTSAAPGTTRRFGASIDACCVARREGVSRRDRRGGATRSGKKRFRPRRRDRRRYENVPSLGPRPSLVICRIAPRWYAR